ncbi:c-type cytochrome [Phreatobacter cathodiphilus]|uniref:Cytochrome c family protein n=1 Tax=Phreatobacter cathodiphilus TaxID=1868589 RepID=A0A2S0N732_9HYPH|nr:cytochrome c family protein [Phreatobacter cathodiphilus]AVO43926.1 cytochrome c family protein [Phreatobacter cathodiphilus]
MRIPLIAAALASLATAPTFAQQAGDAAAGERVFAQCRACHQVGETARNLVGPQLNGLFGRRAGSVAGYNYSPAYKTPEVAEKTWSPENFATYIRDPRAVTPGTRMIFVGLRDDTQIANLTAYLQQFGTDGKKAP